MSSWFWGLGSGLGQFLDQVGGSLASRTGHASSVTNDMPVEDTEEAGELPDGGSKEREAMHALCRSENQRLRKLCADLEEQREASEPQTLQQATVYRHLLMEKERDLNHLRGELARLRGQQSPAAPVAQPQPLDALTQLEAEVLELNVLKGHLEEEVKQQQKMIENHRRSKRQLLEALQEQRQEMHKLKCQHELMTRTHTQLLAERDQELKTLQETMAGLTHEENTQAGTSNSEPDRTGHSRTDPGVGQLTEKQEALQNSLQEKHLLEANRDPSLSLQENVTDEVNEKEHLKCVLLALKQAHVEKAALQAELQRSLDGELRLKQELERLHDHLLKVQDSHTQELLAAEGREAQLRKEVTVLEEKLLSSSIAMETASRRAELQAKALQEQLHVVSRQKDAAAQELSVSQGQVQHYALSLSSLQRALDPCPPEGNAMDSAEPERCDRLIAELQKRAENTHGKVLALQQRLEEAYGALDSASRLTERLDTKDEELEELRRQNQVQREMLDDAHGKLLNVLDASQGKVDKVLMRNLLMGHLHAPKPQRPEVLRSMGSLLGIGREDMQQLLKKEQGGVSGWLAGWLAGGPRRVPNTPARPNLGLGLQHSTSELSGERPETEARASVPTAPLSLRDTEAPDSPARRPLDTPAPGSLKDTPAPRPGGRPDGNPFLVPLSAAVALMNPAGCGPGGPGPLLFKPLSIGLPTLIPVPGSPDNTAASGPKDPVKQQVSAEPETTLERNRQRP